MDARKAAEVRERAIGLLEGFPVEVRSQVSRDLGETPKPNFFVEHRVESKFAQLLHVALTPMSCVPMQIYLHRFETKPGGDWIVRQGEYDIVACFTDHVNDHLFDEPVESPPVIDDELEADVRRGLDEAFHGQFHVSMFQDPEHGLEVVISGLPDQDRAWRGHSYLVERYERLRKSTHFDIRQLSSLDSRYSGAAWCIYVRER